MDWKVGYNFSYSVWEAKSPHSILVPCVMSLNFLLLPSKKTKVIKPALIMMLEKFYSRFTITGEDSTPPYGKRVDRQLKFFLVDWKASYVRRGSHAWIWRGESTSYLKEESQKMDTDRNHCLPTPFLVSFFTVESHCRVFYVGGLTWNQKYHSMSVPEQFVDENALNSILYTNFWNIDKGKLVNPIPYGCFEGRKCKEQNVLPFSKHYRSGSRKSFIA